MDNSELTPHNALTLSGFRINEMTDLAKEINIILEEPTEKTQGLLRMQMVGVANKVRDVEHRLKELQDLISQGIKNLEKREAK